MDNPPATPPARKPRLLRRIFTWRVMRRVFIRTAWAVTIIALLYGIENWRCRRAWEKYRAAAEARGEHLDLAWFVPKPVPDDQNFAKYGSLPETAFAWSDSNKETPWWKDRFALAKSYIKFPTPTANEPRHFHLADLAAWEKALDAAEFPDKKIPRIEPVLDPDPASRTNAAPGVLRGLDASKEASIIEEMRAASVRPHALYPVNYNTENPITIALPHYSVLQRACLQLELMACAKLALGRSDDAMKDLRLMFYLTDSTMDEPSIIGMLVRNTIRAFQTQVIWEGLAQHRWSDAQLQEIQREMLSTNLLAEMTRALDAERANFVAANEYYTRKMNFNGMIADISHISEDAQEEPQWPGLLKHPFESVKYALRKTGLWLMPHGWYYLERIRTCEGFKSQYQSVFDLPGRRIYPRQLEANVAANPQKPGDVVADLFRHRFMSSRILGVLEDIVRKPCAGSQCNVDLAAIACALERCRLATGAYPSSLDGLAPAFIPALPHDPLTGESYRYHPVQPDSYTLYSVGWNLQDDGGKAGERWYSADGDWMWQ